MEIRTISKPNKVGRALLLFLSVIIDKNLTDVNYIFEDLIHEQKPLTISNFINFASTDYSVDIFIKDVIFTRQLNMGDDNYCVLYKWIDDVDIWTLNRIEHHLKDTFK
jgi:hypothetical protein